MSTASPYALYIGRFSPNSRRSIASQLLSLCKLMQWDDAEREQRLYQVDYAQAMVIRQTLTAAGWSARSINRAMIAVRGIVKVAVLQNLANQQQLAQLESIAQLKHGEHQGNALTTKQVEQLFYQLRAELTPIGYRNLLVFALLLGTGLRRSELVALSLKDYDKSHKTLLVRHGKGNKSRVLYLPEWCLEYMQAWLKIRSMADGYLLCSVYADGKVKVQEPMHASTVYRLIKQKLQDIGVENGSPHDMRRTFITRLLSQSVDINTVRQMAGHSSISTTTIYDKRDHEFMKQAAAALNYRSKP